MDVPNEDSQVPVYDGKIFAKVTRVSWNPAGGMSNKVAASAPAPAAPQQNFQQPAAPPAPAPAPPAPTQNLIFDEPFGAPARQQPPAQRKSSQNDDFDALFG